MDIREIQEKFEDLLLVNPDFDESLLEKDEEGSYSDSDIQHMYSMFEAGTEVREQWQAAKAQAVPDLGELQERIAGRQYYHDEHGHMIVDMDDVVKEISGFDSWKAQAVPEGFVLVSAEQLNQWGHMANYAEQYGCPECFEARGYAHSLACEINEFFAIEAQEQK